MRVDTSSTRAFEEQLARLVRGGRLNATKLDVRRRSWIYHGGDRDAHLYWVEHGLVKTVFYTEAGKECVFAVYGLGSVFGEMCLAQEERMEGAGAISDSIVWKIPLGELLQALASPDLHSQVVRHLTGRLLEQQCTIASLVMLNSEERLASMILQLARKIGKRSHGDLHLDRRMSHEELSAMIGTTRSRVGYFLKRFHEAGLVEINRRSSLIIHEDRMMHFANRSLHR